VTSIAGAPVVVDASIAIKWLLDEPDSEPADRLISAAANPASEVCGSPCRRS
jgi:predicted nucleic acid-binding protein